MFAISIENPWKRKYHIFQNKCVNIFYSKCGREYKNIFKKEESIEVLKFPGLINNIEKYQKIYKHVWKDISQEFRLKKREEIKNY